MRERGERDRRERESLCLLIYPKNKNNSCDVNVIITKEQLLLCFLIYSYPAWGPNNDYFPLMSVRYNKHYPAVQI